MLHQEALPSFPPGRCGLLRGQGSEVKGLAPGLRGGVRATGASWGLLGGRAPHLSGSLLVLVGGERDRQHLGPLAAGDPEGGLRPPRVFTGSGEAGSVGDVAVLTGAAGEGRGLEAGLSGRLGHLRQTQPLLLWWQFLCREL